MTSKRKTKDSAPTGGRVGYTQPVMSLDSVLVMDLEAPSNQLIFRQDTLIPLTFRSIQLHDGSVIIDISDGSSKTPPTISDGLEPSSKYVRPRI